MVSRPLPTIRKFLDEQSPLIIVGLLAEVVYLLAFVRQFPLLRYYGIDTDMGGLTGHSHSGFLLFVGSFLLLFVLLAIAWRHVQGRDGRPLLLVILGFGAMFAVTMAFVYPVTAIDLYTYVAQSRILVAYHQNPIFTPPAAFGADPIMRLTDGWSTTGAPYGPVGIVIDAIPTAIGGANLLLDLLLTKLMFLAMMLGNAFLVYRILHRVSPGWAMGGALLVAWNPLILFEVGANGHNDAAMMLLVLLALDAVAVGETATGTFLVVVSALVKYGSAVLIPLFIVNALVQQKRGRVRYLLQAGASSAAFVALAYFPFWRGPVTLQRTLLENTMHFESFGSVLATLLPIDIDVATAVGRLLFVPVYLYAVWLARGDVMSLVRACFLALFGLLALGVANFKIWYATWPNTLAPATPLLRPRIAALLFGYFASISAAFYGYIWVWGQLRNFDLVNLWAYILAFLPAGLVLVLPAVRRLPALRGLERFYPGRTVP